MPTKIKLLLILSLAIVLRFWNINSLPALNPDEAALGYNAYSLLLTGKDEHGISWPIHFKSFGDYKPGGYVYMAIPFIKVLGLTPLAVRLPNLIFSILTIYFLYKLILLVTENSKLATLTALVLAINPWAIHFSRGAWESSTALFFLVLGLYLFYKKSNLFPFPLVIALYTYHSARLIIPALFFILFIKFYKQLLNKKTIISMLLAGVLCIPLAFSFLNSGGTTRLAGVGLSADRGPLSRSEELLNQHPNFNYFDRAIHNRRVLYTISWAQKYLSHYDLNFLFLNGDDVPRSKSPEMGQLYLIELPLIILGIYFLLTNPKLNSLQFLVISLLVTSPLASSLTFQAPSALRALPLVIPLSILTALGLWKLLARRNASKASFWLGILVIGYLYSILYFLSSYFIHSPQRYPFAWNTGFDKVMPYVNSQKNIYENIYITDKYDQPYILYLFFNKYDPTKIQSQIKLTPPDKFGFSTVEKIDNINFKIPEIIPPNSLVIDHKYFYEKI